MAIIEIIWSRSMTNTLLVGSSAGMLSIARKLKGYGHKLYVLGGISDDPCHILADQSLIVNYLEPQECLDATRDLPLDFVVPGSNDIAFATASEIANQHGIQTFDDSAALYSLHNKTGFRELLLDLGIRQPIKLDLSSPDNISDFLKNNKILVKPELSFSGKGISIVESVDEFQAAIKLASSISRNKEVLLEEFIEGQLYSTSVFLKQQKCIASTFSNEFCNINPYAVDSSFTPSDLSEKSQNNILFSVEKIARHLKLKDGLIHIQFIVGSDSRIYFIECMRRLIGDFFGQKICHAYNYDFYDNYLRPYIGMSVTPLKRNSVPKKIYRDVLGGNNEHQIDSISFARNIHPLELIPLSKSGDIIEGYPNGKSGILFYMKDEGSTID